MKPLVSIIIPVYNVESEYLIPCIESVINQTYTNIEILLIDDKSTTPNVLTVFKQYKQQDSRITIIEKEVNEGVSFGRQNGIDSAKGEYLLFIDGDDYITHECIEVLLDKAIQSDADMVIGDMWRTFKNRKEYTLYDYDLSESNGFVKALLAGNCGGVICNRLIKAEKIKQLELPNLYFQCNDTMVNFLIASKHFKIEHVSRPLYNWVQRQTSETHSRSKASLERAVSMANWINDFVATHFTSVNLQNETAYYNLSVWALLLAWGIKKPYSCDTNEYRKNIYNIYWKNKWAKNKLSFKNRLLIRFNRNAFLSIFYKTYAKFIKPLLKKG